MQEIVTTPDPRLEALAFRRPATGPVFLGGDDERLRGTGQVAWRGNGGPTRNHPFRSLPFTLCIDVPPSPQMCSVHLLGVFAQFSGPEQESPGTVGAMLQVCRDDTTLFRQDLVNGRHYQDALRLEPIRRLMGDGTSIHTVGVVDIEGASCRIDVLSVDLPPGLSANSIRFKVATAPSCFTIFDVFAELPAPHGCPFHSAGGGVPLSAIGAIVRLGDRVAFSKAMAQLGDSVEKAVDLDEARGQALTFLAVVTAAMLETGGSRQLVREQLDAARELEAAGSGNEVFELIKQRIEGVAIPLFRQPSGPSEQLVDRALAVVERNFAKDLTDASVAQQLGLSTSHFRYLFRQTTGQPFHKYLVAIRLEKARQLLQTERGSVSDVARAVGFTGLSHFSRAFVQRFEVSPTTVRRGTG